MENSKPAPEARGLDGVSGGKRWEAAASERLEQWRQRLLAAVRLEQRLALLHELGLTDAEVARAVGPDAKARSIRRWRVTGVAPSRVAERWEPIDNLCAIVGFFLADGTYDEEGIVAWLRSRHESLGYEHPLERLGTGDFAAVLAAAESTLRPAVSQQPAGKPGPIAKAARRAKAGTLASLRDSSTTKITARSGGGNGRDPSDGEPHDGSGRAEQVR